MDGTFLLLLHSILRYVILLLVAAAIIFSFRGVILRTPLLNGHRMITVMAVAVAHIQLFLGLILYIMRGWYQAPTDTRLGIFWKFEHIASMILAIALITIGRVLSKKAKTEYKKQLLVGIFFLIALLLMLMATPWPFREVGFGRGWI